MRHARIGETIFPERVADHPLNSRIQTALSRRRRGFKSRWGRQYLARIAKHRSPRCHPVSGRARRWPVSDLERFRDRMARWDARAARELKRKLCRRSAAKKTDKPAPKQPRTLADRFWAKVDQRGPDHPYDLSLGPCHIWLGGKRRRGYGTLWRDGKPASAARIGWELLHEKPFPPELEPLHSCDRPSCVNGAHIRPGTRKENVADMHARGRSNPPRGKDHWNWGGRGTRRSA